MISVEYKICTYTEKRTNDYVCISIASIGCYRMINYYNMLYYSVQCVCNDYTDLSVKYNFTVLFYKMQMCKIKKKGTYLLYYALFCTSYQANMKIHE